MLDMSRPTSVIIFRLKFLQLLLILTLHLGTFGKLNDHNYLVNKLHNTIDDFLNSR